MKLSPISDYGNLITKKEWEHSVRRGDFTDFDGTGYWATATEMSDVIAPFDINTIYPDWVTHVVWFSK